MNRGSFLKGLLGIGAASLIKTDVKAQSNKSFKESLKIIDKISKKICNAFITKNSELVSDKDYSELSEAYDIFLDEFLRDDGYGDGSDFHFKKGAFSKIRYYLIKGNINLADSEFLKYFGDVHKLHRIHNFKSDLTPHLAIIHKHYAEHLLYYNYIGKAKTKINWFKQNCNEYALSKLENKRIWNAVDNDYYKGDYKFIDKFSC